MTRTAWTVVASTGAVAVLLSLVAVLPMAREAQAVRSVRDRYAAERLDPLADGASEAAYRCGGREVVLSDAPDPASPDSLPRRPVRIAVGDTVLETVAPVAVHRDREGPNRYWNRVAPFRWTDREAGTEECGVVYRLPSDTAAVRRAREERGGSYLAFFLNDIRGARPPHLRALRFRVIRWDADGTGVREQDFAYEDWSGDPYGTLVANLLGSPIGLRNQSLSFWPSLFFPILYPLGLGVLGFLLLAAGIVGRARSAGPA